MNILDIEGVRITALCDLFEEKLQAARECALKKKGYEPSLCTKDYNELINSPDVDVVMIFASWEVHIPATIAAMKAGKPVGVEVAGAYSVEDCWELVKTYEKTKTPVMMLENCCYGRNELMLLNMIKKGFFGTVVHCNGGYHHDLRGELVGGALDAKNHGNYRFYNYRDRNCENYPTHELGPIAQMLDINRGNRMVSLVSVSSKSAGLHEYIKDKHPDNEELMNTEFKQGDVITTVIKCARGETITLTLDTTLPRFYSRDLKVLGTKAAFEEASNSIFLEGSGDNHETDVTTHWDSAKKYADEYEHPIWKKYLEDGIREGHGGIDWLVLNAFFDAIKENKPMPIDVYDMASWMAVTTLSETSIALGTSVEVPDFTRGKWNLNQ